MIQLGYTQQRIFWREDNQYYGGVDDKNGIDLIFIYNKKNEGKFGIL